MPQGVHPPNQTKIKNIDCAHKGKGHHKKNQWHSAAVSKKVKKWMIQIFRCKIK